MATAPPPGELRRALRVLCCLIEAREAVVTDLEIMRRSRLRATAMHQAIRLLRRDGFVILRDRRLGYQLLEAADHADGV